MPEQNTIFSKLLQFDTLVYEKHFFCEDHPPKCMYSPSDMMMEKMMKCFINLDEKEKRVEPSLEAILAKLGV